MSNHLRRINLQLFGEDESFQAVPETTQDPTVSEEQKPSSNDESIGESEAPDEDFSNQDYADLDTDEFGEEPKGVPDDTYKRMRIKAEREAQVKFEKERQELINLRQQIAQEQTEKAIRDKFLSSDNVLRRAEEEGMTEDQARKLLELEMHRDIQNERQKVQERFNNLQQAKSKLAKDRYYSILAPEVEAMVADNPDLDYEFTYAWLKHEKGDELEAQVSSQVQKQTVANIHDRNRRRSVRSEGGITSNDATDPMAYMDNDAIRMSQAFGHDPREIAGYVKKNIKRKGV